MVWVGRDLQDHPVPTPLSWAGTPSTSPGCLRAPSNLALSTAREGAATASLGNLCLTTLLMKNFFLISNLNVPFFSLKSLLPFWGSLEENRDWDSHLDNLIKPRHRLRGCESKLSMLTFPHLNTTSATWLGSCEAISSTETLSRMCQGKN